MLVLMVEDEGVVVIVMVMVMVMTKVMVRYLVLKV